MTGTTGATGATGPTKSFEIKSRITHPVEVTTVEAETREHAIHQAIAAGDPGDEVEVLQAVELPTPIAGATGATGVSGPTGTAAAAPAAPAPAKA
jgi:hypothetical protein